MDRLCVGYVILDSYPDLSFSHGVARQTHEFAADLFVCCMFKKRLGCGGFVELDSFSCNEKST